MMLRALYDYARRKDLLSDPDFEKKRVDYLLRIDRDGRVLALVPTADGGRSDERMVPRMPPKRTIKILPGFFFDNAKYVLGLGGDPAKRARNEECVAAFRQLVDEAAKATGDAGALAVSRFFAHRDRELPKVLASRPEAEWTGSEKIAFVLDGDDAPIHERDALRARWSALRNQEVGGSGRTFRCLVTGVPGPAAQLHRPIMRLPSSQSAGTSVVSFNKPAFSSHGLEQGENAPVSRAAAEGYVTALNELLEGTPLRRFRYGVPVGGDAVTVFWTSGESPAADDLMDLFAPPPSQDRGLAIAESPLRGIEPSGLDDEMAFYAVTLSANISRVVVRDWFQSTVAEVKRNVRRYFEDLRIGRGAGPIPVWLLVKALEAPGGKDLSPDLGTKLFAAALQGRPFARELLAAALRRLRIPPDKDGQRMLEIRCAIIKATLLRLPGGGAALKEVSVSLDEGNTQVPYLLGRLFAVLERLQTAALGKEINATIRDKYFGSASATPAIVFPRLLRLSVHHVAKAESGEWLEMRKAKIIAALPAQAFPSTMDLVQQGLFAIGYYHQREKLFEGKPKDEKAGDAAA